MSDTFRKVKFNSNKYNNFVDMYGASLSAPVPTIYYKDMGVAFGYPPSGGVFAADGNPDKDKFISDCVQGKFNALPKGSTFIRDPRVAMKITCAKEWDSLQLEQSKASAKSTSQPVSHPINKIQSGATILGGALVFGIIGHSALKFNGLATALAAIVGAGIGFVADTKIQK